MSSKRRTFDPETKMAVVKEVVEKGRSGAQVAREYGVPESSVYKWVRQYRTHPQDTFPGSGVLSRDTAQTIRLRREVKRLEAENEFLKNAAAYFARQKA
jgi:transposase